MKKNIIFFLIITSSLLADKYRVFDEEIELDYPHLGIELHFLSKNEASPNQVFKLYSSILEEKIRREKKHERIAYVQDILSQLPSLSPDEIKLVSEAGCLIPNQSRSSIVNDILSPNAANTIAAGTGKSSSNPLAFFPFLPYFYNPSFEGHLYGSTSSLSNLVAQSSGEAEFYFSNSKVDYLFMDFSSAPVQLSHGFFSAWSMQSISTTSPQLISENSLVDLQGDIELDSSYSMTNYFAANPGKAEIVLEKSIPGYEYLSWGFWKANPNIFTQNISVHGTFVIGSKLTSAQTLQSLAPREQRELNYKGLAIALQKVDNDFKLINGTSSILVNFNSGNVFGSVNFDDLKLKLQNGRLNTGIDGGLYQGQVSIDGSGTGDFQGRFYGNKAQETAGSFSVNGAKSISGSFVAKRP